jgi:hypothetical protein
MTMIPRWSLCAATAVSLLLSACALRPDWAGRLDIDYWSVPRLRRQIEQGQRVQAAGDDELRRIDERASGRERVAGDLRAGRIGLLEAAACFRDLGAGTDAVRYLHVFFAGDSDDERYCRQVIYWAHSCQRCESPEEADRLADALEQELNEYRRQEGGVRLP